MQHVDSGQMFLTDSGVAIPPQGEMGVTVTAKEKGSQGNVMPGRWTVAKLPPYLQERVYGESAQSFSGGVTVAKPLSEDEVTTAKNKLSKELEERLRGKLTAEVGGAAVREDLLSFKEIETETSVPIGSKASSFEVLVKLEGSAFVVDENDLLGLTLLKLRSEADPEQEFVEYNPQSFATVLLRQDVERGEAVIRGSLAGTFATKLAPTVFTAENLAGLSAEEVKEKLNELPGVGEVEVSFSPGWVKAVPSNTQAVEIVVRSKKQS